MTTKYYVDQAGKICDTSKAPDGFTFKFVNHPTHNEVWLVVSNTGEVHDEYQLWDSLEALQSIL